MALTNRNNLPPGGWMFDQKSNDGGVIKSNWLHRMSAFSDMVSEIVKFREANRLINADAQNVAVELDDFQCARLNNDAQFCNQKKTTPLTRLIRQPVRAVVENVEAAARKLGQLNDGRKILSEWVGEGGEPVKPEVAQARSDVCTGRNSGVPCPFNQDGYKPVEAVAEAIRKQLEKKSDFNLITIGEDKLKTCTLCLCHLPLKVFVPIKFIRAHMTAEKLSEIKQAQPKCWQVTEQL